VLSELSTNWKVKAALWLGLLAIMLACALPPWKEPISGQSAGYSWLWTSPYQTDLKNKRALGLRRKEAALSAASAKVQQARKALTNLRNSPQELERGRLGGFSLEGALVAEYSARTELKRALEVFQTVESNPSSMWVESSTAVEIDLTVLLIEVSVIAVLTAGAALSLVNSKSYRIAH
jgi:hypothetical protein